MWVINEVDASKALVELSLYNQFTIGGEKTWPFAGFCQSGLWVQFNEEGKKNILNGSVISFDNYLTASENIFYLKIELKEEETRKVIKKLFIPKEKLLFDKWQTFKIPVENVPSGSLTLAVGVITRYHNFYNPQTTYMAIDNIAIE